MIGRNITRIEQLYERKRRYLHNMSLFPSRAGFLSGPFLSTLLSATAALAASLATLSASFGAGTLSAQGELSSC
jgi:hypothetical protein